MNFRKYATAAVFCLLTSVASQGLDPRDASSQYKPYPDQNLPALTAAPQGYEPFHMEHYGRHGSRWLITTDNYGVPVAELEKAERAGVLTAKGDSLLALLRLIQADSRGRLGELTPLGARQHQGIARRMAANFPEIFREGTRLDARSTVVIRCILSMLNEVQTLEILVPGITVHTDASEADMYYMNQHDPVKNSAIDSAKNALMPDFNRRHDPGTRWLSQLVSDPAFASDSINVSRLFDELFEVSLNMGSHDGVYPEILTEVFTPEEIEAGWQRNNANWMLNGANSALTGNRAPLGQRNLMRNMIESADTALVSPRTSANLRFGHETMVLSLACLMQLADYGVEQNDLDALADRWRAYEIFPMGCNLQLVFYRRPGSTDPEDVLVKILLNEHEMPTLLARPVEGPYYRWSDLRDAILPLLDK